MGGSVGLPHSGASCQELGLDFLSIFKSFKKVAVENSDQETGEALDEDDTEPEETIEVNIW